MDTKEEYFHLQESLGLFDFSLEGKILVSGKDRVDFLNGLVSNDVQSLPVNTGIPAAFLDKFGKIISDCQIFNFERHLLILLPFLQRKKIMEKLKQDAALVDAQVEDITAQYALLSIQGKKVGDFLEELTGRSGTAEISESETPEKTLPLWHCRQQVLAEVDVAVLRLPRSSVPSVDLLIPTLAYKNILAWLLEKGYLFSAKIASEGFVPLAIKPGALVAFPLNNDTSAPSELNKYEKGKKYGLQKMNYKTYDILRLEAGIPLFGLDFDETTILPEIGEEAISYTKGCYVGQEVVARIKNVGKGMTAKKLVKLEVEGNVPFPKGTIIYIEDKEAGYITSSAYSPGLGKVVALGFVKRGFYDGVNEVEVGLQKCSGKIINNS